MDSAKLTPWTFILLAALAGCAGTRNAAAPGAGRVKVTWFSAGISLLAALFVYAALSIEIGG